MLYLILIISPIHAVWWGIVFPKPTVTKVLLLREHVRSDVILSNDAVDTLKLYIINSNEDWKYLPSSNFKPLVEQLKFVAR